MSENQLSFLKHINKKNIPKKIKLGTDCSGIEAPLQALELLGVKVDHMFSCDNDDC
jgi:hypothetical protein